MGCTESSPSFQRGESAHPTSVLSGSAASYLIHADVRTFRRYLIHADVRTFRRRITFLKVQQRDACRALNLEEKEHGSR